MSHVPDDLATVVAVWEHVPATVQVGIVAEVIDVGRGVVSQVGTDTPAVV